MSTISECCNCREITNVNKTQCGSDHYICEMCSTIMQINCPACRFENYSRKNLIKEYKPPIFGEKFPPQFPPQLPFQFPPQFPSQSPSQSPFQFHPQLPSQKGEKIPKTPFGMDFIKKSF